MAATDPDLLADYGVLRRRRAEAALRARGVVRRDARWLLEHVALYAAHMAADEQGVPVPQAGTWLDRLAETERRLDAGPPFASPPRPGLADLGIIRAVRDAERAR